MHVKTQERKFCVGVRVRQNRMCRQIGGHVALTSHDLPCHSPPGCSVYCTLHMSRKPCYIHSGSTVALTASLTLCVEPITQMTARLTKKPSLAMYSTVSEEICKIRRANARQYSPLVENKTNQVWEPGYTMYNLQPTEKPIRKTK